MIGCDNLGKFTFYVVNSWRDSLLEWLVLFLMTKLTSSLLDGFPYERFADNASVKRGRNYFNEGRVVDIELYDDNEAICSVSGDSGDYIVSIAVDEDSDRLSFECDCPYAENHFCKHMVAAALELSDYLRNREGGEQKEDRKSDSSDLRRDRVWEDRLGIVFHQLPRAAAAGGNFQSYAAFLLMEKSGYYYSVGYSFTPYIVKAKNWQILEEILPAGSEMVNDLLDKNCEWIKYCEELYGRVNPEGCVNLSPDAVNLMMLMYQYLRSFGNLSTITKFFGLLHQFKVPVFLGNKYKQTVAGRITVLPEPVKLGVCLTQSDSKLLLQAALQGETESLGGQKPEIVSTNPPWLLMGKKLFQAPDENAIPLISSFPITIPESDIDDFRNNYLRRIAQSLPVTGKMITWQDVSAEPVPRLYLHDDEKKGLRAEMRFGYGEYEVNASRDVPAQSVDAVENSWNLVRVQRQPEREQAFHQLLADPVYRLKRAGSTQPYGTFELRARAHPFDFLLYSIPKLTAASFEIFGEEKLKAGKINRATPSLSVNITSGIDWFDLQASVQFGDQQVDFRDVRKALKQGERYIKLTDGTIGRLPDEWLEKYKHLWELARETETGFRVSDFQLPLVDALLEDGVVNQAPSDLNQRRERLRSFEKITPHPLPDGFVGELRPYQKHGFDWLYFLHQYKFGGILADDMGLGKTVQVLVYLLSLKEAVTSEHTSRAASLLVVPNSLIDNWQRESTKFTPGLHFLEYVGNFRKKDTTVFNDYDIVITTYGTMLRDIELLRQYPFDHIILDESQAIKNPLAKSARAARLLNASYRIVVTGTPVENNTFELWSQFAFINPGLLGSLEYFKKAFAVPIESEQDEQAAATLRKLTYPFILRRTKKQVAPELPPRIERTIFTDMDAVQKRLYAQTKERYRAELLGLIEKQGINDTRFKILEGMLRLRQIAINPALVEPGYRGEAPKFEFLLETLETLQTEKHKALIFSQFVETLHLLQHELDARKIRYEYLDGQTRDRQAHVDSFQCDPAIPFFLISLKAGGVGLNLTAADYVIHIDPWWNPAVEMQASDRAHRIGQDKPVFIYKIITHDTVEEKILQLQDKKRALVDNLITSDANFFKSLTKDDVKMLFE